MSFKTVVAVFSGLILIIGTAFAVDARYVSQSQFSQEMEQTRQDMAQIYVSQLEDEIFQLELIIQSGKGTDLEIVRLKRLQQRLSDIKRKMEKGS